MAATDTLEIPARLPQTAPAVAHPTLVRRPDEAAGATRTRFAQISTLIVWTGCVAVGLLGVVLPYARPKAPARAPEPVVVEKLEIALAPDLVPPAVSTPATSPDNPPPPAALAPATPAQPTAVADASLVAFALPVEGPTMIVDASQASHARPAVNRPAESAGTGLPAPKTLVFGQGEGRQPAPEYPLSAMNQRQQGTVGVRFLVTPEGRVRDTTVAAPSPWPALDESALRTIRHRWRFPRGPVRVYEVAIRFALAP